VQIEILRQSDGMSGRGLAESPGSSNGEVELFSDALSAGVTSAKAEDGRLTGIPPAAAEADAAGDTG
jgi:hypothetical protein